MESGVFNHKQVLTREPRPLDPGTSEIITRTARITLEASGMVRSTVLHGAEQLLEDARANKRAVGVVSAGRQRPLLIDLRGLKSIDYAAQKHYGERDEFLPPSAVAMLVLSPLSRIVASFFATTLKFEVPSQTFTSEDEATLWLEQFLP